ncbi:unnamed protein product [Brachionus calyciflorus]|uniref:sn-1-specific diacylglycerol lipase n=1 Tax=Brachionus calyciflorus TaxID=104777 RepID=A0A813N2F9_9BILA|nr:unnamed protein product [Brachionus calyciflorus]
MPGIELFNRRWNIGSDDLVYPGLLEFIIRLCWFAPQLAYFVEYKQDFKCGDIDLLHLYYIGYLVLLFFIILVQLALVYISSLGTITNTRPRAKLTKFLYLRIFLLTTEILWSFIGTFWLAKKDWNSCSKLINISVLVNIVFSWVAFSFVAVLLFIFFDPISHLPETDVHTKRHILYSRLKSIFFCCYCCLYTGNGRNVHYENSYKQISSILELIFRGGNMTPSDVLAGIILLSNKEKDQFSRESRISKKYDKLKYTRPIEQDLPRWMNINEASYYIKYAVATYSWPYYIYMNNLKGFREIYCPRQCCCCCSSKSSISEMDSDDLVQNFVIDGDTKTNRHLRAFKFLSKIKECDLIYGNFENDLFFVPFCVLVDHFKKTVVITIRGTLSLRDVITDITAECGYFDIDDLTQQPCHIGILNTADNILNKIKSMNLLEKAFDKNPGYQLVVTGHSLGAGTAVILSLKLKKDYPNVRCIAYSPPGGLVSTSLADYTKSFVMSVVLGDDIVPRLSLRSVHNLKADILKELYNCNLPKYKIIWKYSTSFIRSTKKTKSKTPVINRRSSESDLSDDTESVGPEVYNSSSNSNNSTRMLIDRADDDPANHSTNEDKLLDVAIKTIKTTKEVIRESGLNNEDNQKVISYQVRQMMSTVYETYPELQLPGNILYIYHIKSDRPEISKRCKRLRSLCSKLFCFACNSIRQLNNLEFDSRWASREEFKKILITNRVFIDHFPNTVEDGLKYFNRNQNYLA